jgi:nitrogen fixation NifU-like protein
VKHSRYYSRTVLDHFRNPRNVRSMRPNDGEGHAVNPACSDHVRMFVRIQDGKLSDVSFQAQGCAACIAAASMTTQLALGRTIEAARNLSTEEVVEALEGLPPKKIECSVIAPTALRDALSD